MLLHNKLLFAVALCLMARASHGLFQCHGDGWGPADDKCIKLFAVQMSMEEGIEHCAQEYSPELDIMTPRLLEISSEKDQELVEGYLRKNPNAPGFWLGAMRVGNSSEFKWSMNYELEFTNWAPGHPSDVSDRKCVELQSEASKNNELSNLGLWKDVICTKGNWVICERIPALSTLEIILAIRALNKKVVKLNGTTLDQFENVLTYLNSSIDTLEANHSADIDQLEADVTSLNSTIDELKVLHGVDVNLLNATIDQVKFIHDADVVSLNEKIDQLQSTHEADITTVNTTVSQLRTDHTTLSNSHTELSTSVTTLQNNHSTLSASHTTLSNSVSALQTSHNTLSTSHNTLNTKVNTIDTTVTRLNTDMTTAKTNIVTLQNAVYKPVPIGFIYFELPRIDTTLVTAPRSIWPNCTWTDISARYAGSFFRVLGGNAGTFGAQQNDAFQGHAHGGVYTTKSRSGTDNTNDKTQVDDVYTGNSGGPVTLSNGSPRTASETRPLNYAVRVWQRTA